MLKKRIIPCLDIKDGQTVKGVNFVNIRHAGDPVELARIYSEQGADELIFLDITATVEKRTALVTLVKKVAAALNIPFTVGGGIRSVSDVGALLEAGADKVSVNSAAVEHPDLIDTLALSFGSQCVVLAVDTNIIDGQWRIFIKGGREATDKKTFDWIYEGVQRGAGEILLTSMAHDGTKNGFATELTRTVAELVHVPVIASGGAGKPEHFVDIFTEGKADAALAASIFHFGEISIPSLKDYLRSQNIPVR